MRFCYADPPYPGQARKHYADDPQCAEVDHEELIARLCRQYPDGWALSTSSPSLRTILQLCPADVRVMAWVKPFCSFKPGVNPAYAWEPIIVRGGRRRTRTQRTVRDWIDANITLRKGLAGAKPERFAYWLFEVLNMVPGDELVDLYPGTNAITEAWKRFNHEYDGASSDDISRGRARRPVDPKPANDRRRCQRSDRPDTRNDRDAAPAGRGSVELGPPR